MKCMSQVYKVQHSGLDPVFKHLVKVEEKMWFWLNSEMSMSPVSSAFKNLIMIIPLSLTKCFELPKININY